MPRHSAGMVLAVLLACLTAGGAFAQGDQPEIIQPHLQPLYGAVDSRVDFYTQAPDGVLRRVPIDSVRSYVQRGLVIPQPDTTPGADPDSVRLALDLSEDALDTARIALDTAQVALDSAAVAAATARAARDSAARASALGYANAEEVDRLGRQIGSPGSYTGSVFDRLLLHDDLFDDNAVQFTQLSSAIGDDQGDTVAVWDKLRAVDSDLSDNLSGLSALTTRVDAAEASVGTVKIDAGGSEATASKFNFIGATIVDRGGGEYDVSVPSGGGGGGSAPSWGMTTRSVTTKDDSRPGLVVYVSEIVADTAGAPRTAVTLGNGRIDVEVPAGVTLVNVTVDLDAAEATFSEGVFQQGFAIAVDAHVGSGGQRLYHRRLDVVDGTNAASSSASSPMTRSEGSVPVRYYRDGRYDVHVADRVGQLYGGGAIISLN